MLLEKRSIMKFLLKISLCLGLLLAINTSVFAQKEKKESPIITTEMTVSGVCNMCKKRIEKAALIKGVKMADWDKHTQLLKVVYDSRKTTIEMIHQSVSAYGHDTANAKSPDGVYNELPGCCQYRNGIKVH